MINKASYYAHRLAIFYVNGSFPDCIIDHWDQDKDHNSWENLRHASYAQNFANTKLRSTNKSGYRGVYQLKGSSRFYAEICIKGENIRLGSFKSPEEAAEMYNNKAFEIYGEFYNNVNTLQHNEVII